MKKYLLSISLVLTSFITYGQILITEIMYNPPEFGADSLEYIEIYNGYRRDVNFDGYHFTSGMEYTFGDTTVAGGSFIVVCARSSAMKSVFGWSPLQWTSGGLRNSGESIVLEDGDGNVVDSVTYSPSGSWPQEANGAGHSLELCSSAVDNSLPQFWKPSNKETKVVINDRIVYGSPGIENEVSCADHIIEVKDIVFEPAELTIKVGQTVEWQNVEGFHNVNGKKDEYPDNPVSFYSGAPMRGDWVYRFQFDSAGDYKYQCDAHVLNGMVGRIHVVLDTAPNLVINEIMYNPPSNSDDSLEYIELYNPTDRDIALGGMHFTSGVMGELPDRTLPAGAYAIVARDSGAFRRTFGRSALQWTSGSLNNSGESIELSTALNTVIDKVSYLDSGDWPEEADGEGYALVLCDPEANNNSGLFWGLEADPLDIEISGKRVYASPRRANRCDQIQDDVPLYTIDQVRGVDSEGRPDSFDVKCRVRGVVYGIDLQRSDRVQFTIYDRAVGVGIGVFGAMSNGYTVQEGDSLEVEGKVGFFNGLTQLVLGKVTVLSQGQPLVAPEVVDSLGEYTESRLIRMNGVRLVDPGQWRGNGRFFTVQVTNGDKEFTLYIDDAVDLSTMPAPQGILNITGIGQQFDIEAPYTSGYQISPRYADDIEVVSAIGSVEKYQLPVCQPNPFSESFALLDMEKVKRVAAYSLGGQTIIPIAPDREGRVNTSSWPKGIYILRIDRTKGDTQSAIIVKQ